MRAVSVCLSLASLILPLCMGQAPRPQAAAEPGGANLPAQPIGANDLIAVSVLDAPELTRTVRVSADGFIRLPMLKQRIAAQGLLPAELEEAIATALKQEQLLVDPVVTVTVVEYFSRPISVAGAVRNPITFQAVGAVTLLEALTRAGGLNPDAGPEILVTHTQKGPDGKPVQITRRVAVKALFDSADPEANLKLYGGEEIRVPEAGKVYVVGNVKKPGAFPLVEGTETTVLRVLALAEGLAPYAGKQAYIIRRDERTGAVRELPVELKKLMERKAPDVPLVANDILYVPDRSGRRATIQALDRIAGFGATTASGILIWRTGRD